LKKTYSDAVTTVTESLSLEIHSK